MLSDKRGRRAFVFGVGLVLVLFLSVAAGVASGSQRELRAASIEPAGQIETPKSVSGKLAQTDGTLLALRGDKLVNVMVKLDYDAVASYRGTIKGLRATSPRVTGRSLAKNARAVRPYVRYVSRYEARALRAIGTQVRGARLVGRYRQAYGGVAMQVRADQIKKLLRVRGVAAVQRNVLAQPLTDATPAFLGATSVWPSLGGSNRAGEGVKVGIIDTGIWPEHPSYVDPGISHPGGSYGCEFGDGSDPVLGDPFTCNDKLIGAYAKTDTYMQNIGAVAGENCNNATDECSARDADGHGTHTSSTAAGNAGVQPELFGSDLGTGTLSGVAPRARVAMYKV
ncbi:MAG: S8 family serine peptidase, partial [Gaiellaceae bacterium]